MVLNCLLLWLYVGIEELMLDHSAHARESSPSRAIPRAARKVRVCFQRRGSSGCPPAMIPRVCLQCRLRLRTAASINPSRFVAARLYSSGRRDVLGTYEQLLDTTDALRSPELSKLSHSKHVRPSLQMCLQPRLTKQQDKQSERAAQLLQDLPPFLKAAHAKCSASASASCPCLLWLY